MDDLTTSPRHPDTAADDGAHAHGSTTQHPSAPSRNDHHRRHTPTPRKITDGEDIYYVTNRAAPPSKPANIARLGARAAAAISAVPALDAMAPSAIQSLIRASADPSAQLASLSTHSIGREPVVDGHTLTTSTALLVHCLLAFEQPRNRSKGRQFQVKDPVFGQLPDGTTEIRFKSARHMRDVQRDVIARSLPGALQQRRHIEILETGVRRKLVVELAHVTFDDETHPQWILNIRDGISRWATMMAGLSGLLPGTVFAPAPNPSRRPLVRSTDEDAISPAQLIAEVVVPERALTAASNATTLIEQGLKRHRALVDDYNTNLSPPTASDGDGTRTVLTENVWGLLLRQFATAPATVVLRALNTDGEPTPIRRAADSLVADLHTGVDSWDEDDRRLFDAQCAVRAMWSDGHLRDAEAQLWLGLRPVADVDQLFAPQVPSTGSHAGARFVSRFYARLLGPEMYDIVKIYLRSRLDGRYTFARAVEVLAPLANQHWDETKPLSRLWSYQGGPLIEEAVRHESLRLVSPDDYRDLVEDAMTGDRHARAELSLAGGAALLADGVLTTTLVGGSGSATTRLPFRGSVREVFDLLTSTTTGLMTLALAANEFDPTIHADQARHRVVDLAADDCVSRDAGRSPLRLFERDVAAALAEAKAARTTAEDEPEGDGSSLDGSRPGGSVEAQLERQLDALPGLVAGVERAALEALDLRSRGGCTDVGFTEATAEALAEKLMRTSMSIARLSR